MNGSDLINSEEFMFLITDEALNCLRSQIVTSSCGGR